jgi:hypothetical protein
MIINISPEDKKKYKAQLAKKRIPNRKNRLIKLSKKTKNKAFANFDKAATDESKNSDVQVDEHLKMNDSYMRTGWYKPKEK